MENMQEPEECRETVSASEEGVGRQKVSDNNIYIIYTLCIF